MDSPDSGLIQLERLQWILEFLLFLYAGFALVSAAQDWIIEYRENKLAPVRVNLWDSIRRGINPFRLWGRSSWKECDAIVKRGYPVSLRTHKTLFLIPGGAFRVTHLFRRSTIYFPMIWYQYEIEGLKHWGKLRLRSGYGNSAEATAIGDATLGKSITIRYNPQDPGDSVADPKQLVPGRVARA